MSKRDDFSSKTKEIMAKRVGYRCSNPNCRILTIGPKQEPDQTISIGVAAHIKAASPGGARFDVNQTVSQRKSIDNGIWLCESHAKMIDTDVNRFTVDILKKWKELSEKAAVLEIESYDSKILQKDVDIIKSFSIAFDRPVFKNRIMYEGSMEAFDVAIEDTIIALTTGRLFSRNRDLLKETSGISLINDENLRSQMEVIVNMLLAIRDRYRLAKIKNEIIVGEEHEGMQFFAFNNHDLHMWFDESREQVVLIFENACNSVGFKWHNRFNDSKRNHNRY